MADMTQAIEGQEGATPELDTTKTDQRASIFEGLDAARRDMLAENGVDLDALALAEPVRDNEIDAEDSQQTEGDDSVDTAAGDADDGGEQAPPAAAAAPTAAPEPTFKVLIDGKEQEVPLSRLVTNYQIETTARQRLTEATETLSRAREIEEETRRRAAPPQQQEAPPARQDAPPAADEPDYAALADAITVGTPDEIADRLKDVVNKLRQTGGTQVQSMSPEELEARVFEKIEFNGALQTVGEEYSDIFADRLFASMAGQQAQALIQADIAAARKEGRSRRPFVEHFRTALGGIRERLSGYGGGAGGGQDSGENPPTTGTPSRVALSPDRLDRKRSASQPPKPQGSGTPALAPTARPKTELERRREGIRDIASGRHQAF